jgi:hypothetical protein
MYRMTSTVPAYAQPNSSEDSSAPTVPALAGAMEQRTALRLVSTYRHLGPIREPCGTASAGDGLARGQPLAAQVQ